MFLKLVNHFNNPAEAAGLLLTLSEKLKRSLQTHYAVFTAVFSRAMMDAESFIGNGLEILCNIFKK